MDFSASVKRIITEVFPNDESKQDVTVQGSHKKLLKYKEWYQGKTAFHKVPYVVNGRVETKNMYSGYIGKFGAETKANTFLNEETLISVPDDKGNDILQSIFINSGFHSRLNQFGAKYFGLGYGQTLVMPSEIKFTYVKDNPDRKIITPSEDVFVKLSFLDALRCFPITIEDDQVTECAILKISTNRTIMQLHLLDQNGQYVIAEVTGRIVNDSFNIDMNELKVWETKSDTKLFQVWYPANVDSDDLDYPLGTSILSDDVIEWIKAFDIIFDKFVAESRNGGRRRFVSAELTYTDAEGNEVPVPLDEGDIPLQKAKTLDAPNMVHEQIPQLRTVQFIEAMQFTLTMISKKMGLGSKAFRFSMDGRPLQTATAEIISEADAKRDIKRNENLAKNNMIDLCMAIKFVYNTYVKANTLTFERDDIQIRFNDNIIEDTASEKTNDQKEVTLGAMSLVEYRSKWYDESIEDALKFLQENGLLIDKYLPAIQAGVLTPDMFIDMVFGKNVSNREELKQYIIDNLSAPSEEVYGTDIDNPNQNQEEDDEDDDE